MLADTEHGVGALPSVIWEQSSKQNTGADSPKGGAGSQFQTYFNKRPASHRILPSVGSLSQSHPDFDRLERYILDSRWLANNDFEPIVGHPDCLAVADKYSARGVSCYSVFVRSCGSGTFGCAYDRCYRTEFRTVDGALRHLRSYHFNHRPFVCTPSSGKIWYVQAILRYPLTILFLLLFPECTFTHEFLAAANDSSLRVTCRSINDVVFSRISLETVLRLMSV